MLDPTSIERLPSEVRRALGEDCCLDTSLMRGLING